MEDINQFRELVPVIKASDAPLSDAAIFPQYSKNRIQSAGKRIKDGTETDEDWGVLQNWRDSHAYVLTMFRITLDRNRPKIGGKSVLLVQRLKRKKTIIDKLKTGRATNLATMHDMAGCRLIFSNMNGLRSYRKKLHKASFKHQRVKDEKYDYIANPKNTGYRGIHDVYKYYSESKKGGNFNGLQIEVQFRTQVQHAWATAVEISELLYKTRVKFDRGMQPKRGRFFLLASEYLARTHERMSGYEPEISDDDLAQELKYLDKDLKVMQRLKALQKQKIELPNSRNIVLHFVGEKLLAKGFSSSQKAILYRDSIEVGNPDDDVVYVKGDNSQEI